jgi:hypothetical protein
MGFNQLHFNQPQSPVEIGSYDRRDQQWDRIGPDTTSVEQRYGA